MGISCISISLSNCRLPIPNIAPASRHSTPQYLFTCDMPRRNINHGYPIDHFNIIPFPVNDAPLVRVVAPSPPSSVRNDPSSGTGNAQSVPTTPSLTPPRESIRDYIIEAIQTSPRGKLRSSEIYNTLLENHPHLNRQSLRFAY